MQPRHWMPRPSVVTATRLNLEHLEDRSVPVTFTVNTTGDTGTGIGITGDLRYCITQANATPGADTITFAIPGSGVQTVNLLSALPALVDNSGVTIDGYTQPGASANTAVLLIELNGTSAGAAVSGLTITSVNNAVRGLVINRFSGSGIDLTGTSATNNRITGNFIGTNAAGTAALANAVGVRITAGASGNTIGGTVATQRNVISGNAEQGVLITGAGTSSNLLAGNFIGTNLSGKAAIPNGTTGVLFVGDGVRIDGASGNTIGGATAAARNIISGNISDGVDLRNGATGNLVIGNYLGTDVTGTADLGNLEDGVYFEGANANTVGGTTAAVRNVISGNDNNGVFFYGPGSDNNIVQGNYIGTNAAGTGGIANTFEGVFIWQDPTFNPTGPGPSNNTIGGTAAGAGNLIAFNTGTGVTIALDPTDQSAGNRILGNSIHSNGDIGIDLGADGVTPNDPGDADAGPNRFQNYPVITSAVVASGIRTIVGTLSSTPNRTFRIEFFASATGDPSGFGEGEVFLGFVNATTDAAGNASFSFSGPDDPTRLLVTATATDSTTGDTSELSAAVTATVSSVPPAPPVPSLRLTAAGSGAGGGSLVKVYNPNRSERFSFVAYPGFNGEVRVATGDVTGDGVDDIVTGAGPGATPHIKVFDGATGAELTSFYAYSSTFSGGVSVAVGDVTSDGIGEVITGAGPGAGPHVKVFAASGTELASFLAFDSTFAGGVNVGAADLDGDRRAEILTGVASGASPHVKAFRFADLATVLSFYAFDPGFLGGVNLAGGSFLAGGAGFFVVGAATGTSPHVKVFTGEGVEFESFLASPAPSGSGVRVGAEDGAADGPTPIISTGAGPGASPSVRTFALFSLTLVADVVAFDPNFRGGVFVG